MIPWFDSHCHIIDPDFPLFPNQGYLPPPFTADDYLSTLKGPLPGGAELQGGAIVSGSFQGFDQSYLLAALKRLGPQFVGVAQLAEDTSLQELERLDKAGVRALRYNLFRGTANDLKTLRRTADAVYERFAWHIELYVNAADLGELEGLLPQLPLVSIDHLGMRAAGLDSLQYLMEQGVYVKASGFGRIDFDPLEALSRLFKSRPDRLTFGSDLPSTRAAIPFSPDDLQRLLDAVGEQGFQQVLWDNPRRLYRPMA